MGAAASSSLDGGDLCSSRCDEFEDVCCQSKAKNGHFSRRRATEGLIVIDPRLAAAEEDEKMRTANGFRARPTVHVQAFRQRYQLRSESLLRPYHMGAQPSEVIYASTRAPAGAAPRNRFSPISSLEAKISTATQTQTPSYPRTAVVTPSPSPPAAGQHDRTPSSLERNATAAATVTPGTAINGRTRGLAWTPESAADVAKLQAAPTARTPGANQLFESSRTVGSSRATAPADHAAPDSGTTAGSGRLPTPTFNLRDSDKENLRLNLLNRNPPSPAGVADLKPHQPASAIKFMSPLLQRWAHTETPGDPGTNHPSLENIREIEQYL